jgi:hypothetical protein
MMEYATHKFGIADIDWLALRRVGDSYLFDDLSSR